MHWKCVVCNFVWDGESPPEACPKCRSPREKYKQMTDEDWKLVERSKKTNGLYMELLASIPRLKEIAKTGIEDDLDTRCVALFKKLGEEIAFIEKSALAEINGHVNKGKWG